MGLPGCLPAAHSQRLWCRCTTDASTPLTDTIPPHGLPPTPQVHAGDQAPWRRAGAARQCQLHAARAAPPALPAGAQRCCAARALVGLTLEQRLLWQTMALGVLLLALSAPFLPL